MDSNIPINKSTPDHLNVPTQLGGCRFILLEDHSKRPAVGQKGHFKSDTCNYAINDPVLLQHIEAGGNYGIIPRAGTLIIDVDSKALWEQVPEHWKSSFWVRSGKASGEGRHIYLACSDGPTGIKIVFPGELGDVRLSGHNSYVVGPGSVHPDSGLPYQIGNDSEILEVPWDEISDFIESNGAEIEETKEQITRARKILNDDSALISVKYHLRPEDFLYPDNAHPIGNSIVGSHPIHGSETGSNLHIDTSKGLFYCFRHGTGGDGLTAFAISRGIINCGDARPGCLSGCMGEVLSQLESEGLKPVVEMDFTDLLRQDKTEEEDDTAEPRTEDIIPPSQDENVKLLIRSAYNGQRGVSDLFIKAYRDQYRYDHSAGVWYSFTGNYWEPEILQEQIRALTPIQKAFKDSAFALESELKGILAEHGQKHKDDISKNEAEAVRDQTTRLNKDIKSLQGVVRNLDTLAHRKICCEFASVGRDALGLVGNEWDPDPWLLGCPNGIVNLNTGTLRSGEPKDYIRSVTATPFRADAECPNFERFLLEILNEDQDLFEFMHRLLGLALVGDASHKQYLIMLIGIGRNGKDTLLKVLNRVLGNTLCGTVNSALLLDSGHLKPAGQCSPEIMDLMGKRLVFASETGAGNAFDLGVVKSLSGAGDLKGRAPYGKTEIQFRASHLIFLESNHRPNADASERAFWYRVKCVTFPISFVPEPRQSFERPEIKGLSESLLSEAEGILNWLVKGCLAYQEIGLNDPESVKLAIKEYREDVDLIGQFLKDCTTEAPGAEVAASILYDEYKLWILQNNLKAVSGTRFGRDVSSRYKKIRRGTGIFYEGITTQGGIFL